MERHAHPMSMRALGSAMNRALSSRFSLLPGKKVGRLHSGHMQNDTFHPVVNLSLPSAIMGTLHFTSRICCFKQKVSSVPLGYASDAHLCHNRQAGRSKQDRCQHK